MCVLFLFCYCIKENIYCVINYCKIFLYKFSYIILFVHICNYVHVL